MRNNKRIHLPVRLILIILFAIAILLMLMAMAIQEPPLEEFMEYELIIESIPGALDNEQEIKNLVVAEHFRKAAITEWQKQESRWLYLRNYSEAKRLMKIAISIAEEVSSEQASTTSANPSSAPPANLAGASPAKGSSRQ